MNDSDDSEMSGLLGDKSKAASGKHRPHIMIDRRLWYDFTFEVEYLNKSRLEKLNEAGVVETMLVQFHEMAVKQVLLDEGSIDAFEMYKMKRRDDKRQAAAKKKDKLVYGKDVGSRKGKISRESDDDDDE